MAVRWVRLGLGRRAAVAAAMAGLALALAPAASAAALQRGGLTRIENRMLREAATHEARGELNEAEATLRELLAQRSGSAAAVFALERVLRADGRVVEVLPVFDRYIAESPGLSQIWEHKLGVLIEVDSLAAVETTVRHWIRAAPGSPDPYLGGARALETAVGAGRAAALLEEGLDALGELPALLVALGDARLAEGRHGEAAEAWARALGRDRSHARDVLRRIGELGDRREVVAGRVVAALETEPTTVPRLEAAAEVALREGMESEARRLARAVRDRAGEGRARGFLDGFAGIAEELELHETALWAYLELRAITDDPAEARATDRRIAAQALAAGDTLAALAARRRITESYDAGTVERRSAWTGELAVLVESSETDAAMEQLAAFKDEYPGAEDLDPLSAALAARLLGQGRREEAMEVLGGIEGPGAALERAFLLLENGVVADAIPELQAALPELEPSQATEILELTLALGDLSAAGVGLAARAAIASHRSDPARTVSLVREGVDAIPASDRPALLALGARAADRAGLAEEATAFRRRIVAEHPDAREFPEAALRLARAIASHPEGRDEATRILEALIVGHPDSPVVPGARRELRRIQAGIGGAR